MVSITGSVRAGMEVARAAASDLKRVHLELGGKAPVDRVRRRRHREGRRGHRRRPATSTPGRTAPPRPACSCTRASTTSSSRRSSRTCASNVDDRRPARRRRTFYGPVNNANQLERVARHHRSRCRHTREVETGGSARATAATSTRPTVVIGPPAGRRRRAERDLRPGPHRAVVPRRGAGARSGRTACDYGLVVERLDEGPRARDALREAPRLRLRVDQHPHPARRGDAARRVQALRLRQGPVAVRLRGLHARQARDVATSASPTSGFQ